MTLIYGAEAAMEGPGPMRESLDKVIPCTADDISSGLEQNHYQHNVLGC